jgi:biopolymer transport protein ExbD
MRFKTESTQGNGIINISSMIDVMFILIIFFLVTTTFKEEEDDHLVQLPTDKRNQSLSQSKSNLLKINIRENGSYTVMGTQMTEEQLSTWMEGEIKRKPELKVLIRCDENSRHFHLANVMSICRYIGVPKANIAVRTEQR